MPLHIHRLNLSLRIEIADEVIALHSVASPEIVGGELAAAVSDYVRNKALGYYPALDFFRHLTGDESGIDAELLDAVEGLAWLCCNLAREEIQRKLRAVFSTMSVESIQSQAFSMPTVRPGQENALRHLAQHYSPNFVKLDLAVTLIQKLPADERLEGFTRQLIQGRLKGSFKALEVKAFLSE